MIVRLLKEADPFIFLLKNYFFFIDYFDYVDRIVGSWMSAGWRDGSLRAAVGCVMGCAMN